MKRRCGLTSPPSPHPLALPPLPFPPHPSSASATQPVIYITDHLIECLLKHWSDHNTLVWVCANNFTHTKVYTYTTHSHTHTHTELTCDITVDLFFCLFVFKMKVNQVSKWEGPLTRIKTWREMCVFMFSNLLYQKLNTKRCVLSKSQTVFHHRLTITWSLNINV